jgi:hypothetical protein
MDTRRAVPRACVWSRAESYRGEEFSDAGRGPVAYRVAFTPEAEDHLDPRGDRLLDLAFCGSCLERNHQQLRAAPALGVVDADMVRPP